MTPGLGFCQQLGVDFTHIEGIFYMHISTLHLKNGVEPKNLVIFFVNIKQ